MTIAQQEAVSLVMRSGVNHVRLIKPAAELKNPHLYAGKVESTVLTMLLDILGVQADSLPNRAYSLRACNAFNQQWRAHDEVIDETHQDTSKPVTEKEIDETPVLHKYAGRMVTGRASREIAIDSLYQAIPEISHSAKRRRDSFVEQLIYYRNQVVTTANNPDYQVGEILPFSKALQNKIEVTGTLGEVAATLGTLLLDRSDPDSVALFKATSVAMQFGDDLLDWRKDINDYLKLRQANSGPIRPIENLLVATLAENTSEMDSCRDHLDDTSRRSVTWLAELAPQSYNNFKSRFQETVDTLPLHPMSQIIKDIIEVTFYRVLPKAPESGWFYRWAKY